MGDLEQQLLNTNIVLMAAGAWFIMWVIRKIWKGMDKIAWVKKLKPLYPALLCQGFVWIPGAMPGITSETGIDETIAPRILTGLWCGFLASIGYQLLRRLLERQGVELPEDPQKLMPSDPPALDTVPAPAPEPEPEPEPGSESAKNEEPGAEFGPEPEKNADETEEDDDTDPGVDIDK